MRFFLLIVVLAALSACGAESEPNDNHGFGWHYDEKTESGLRLRDVDPGRYSVSQYEADLSQVMSCMGVGSIKAPLVIQRQSLPLGEDFGPLDYGGTYLDTGLILHYAAPAMDAMDSKHARHEFVHYIRMRQGAPDAEHRRHDHWSYRICAGFIH